MTEEDAAAKLQNLGLEIKFRTVFLGGELGNSSEVDVLCSCGFRWCGLNYEDLPRVLADRENGRCSETHP